MIDLSRPAAPSRPLRRDWFAPAITAGSLLVHAAIVAPLVWAPHAEAARPPAEIPIEVVQEPPKPAEKPAAKAAETQASKPAPKPAPKPPEPPRQARAKPPAEKPAAPKPEPSAPKVAERKPAHRKAAEPKQAAKAPEPAKPQERDVAERMARLIGPMQAMAMPSLTGGDNPLDDAVSYRQLVLSQVARQKREDRHDGIPGHAVIGFTIGENGEVVSCEVREKSVDPKLDAEAVAMVYRGAPYPAPPPGAERAFTFGLAFRTL